MAAHARTNSPPMSNRRPVVFLDIDDTLALNRLYNTRQVLAALAGDITVNAEAVWRRVLHEPAKQNLRQLHDEFNPDYVISSSWTLHLSKEQLCQTFVLTGLEFVADNLHEHWCTSRDEDSYRLVEIDAWLDKHARGSQPPFLIIDDYLSGQSLKESHLKGITVFCEPWTGFMYPQLREARQILHRQGCVDN